MDSNMARWMQIVFWNREDVEELHKRERSREKQCEESRRLGKRLIDWRDRDFLAKMQDRYQLNPYWPEKMDQEMRTSKMKSFERDIFTIWGPFFTQENLTNLTEIEAVHKADIAIVASCKQPDRAYQGGDERKRAAVGDKYSKVYG